MTYRTKIDLEKKRAWMASQASAAAWKEARDRGMDKRSASTLSQRVRDAIMAVEIDTEKELPLHARMIGAAIGATLGAAGDAVDVEQATDAWARDERMHDAVTA